MPKDTKPEAPSRAPEPVDIGWQDALNVLEQVKGRYQAFERLESVARLMAGQEQYLRESAQRVTEADETIFQKARVLKELALREIAMETVLKEAQERYEREKAEADAVIHKAQRDYDKMVMEMKTQNSKIAQEMETAMYERKVTLEREIGDLENKKAALEGKIVELKNSIGSL